MASINKAENEVFDGLTLAAVVVICLIGFLIWKTLHGFDLSDWWSKVVAWLFDHLNGTATKGWNVIHSIQKVATPNGTSLGDKTSAQGDSGAGENSANNTTQASSQVSDYDVLTGGPFGIDAGTLASNGDVQNTGASDGSW